MLPTENEMMMRYLDLFFLSGYTLQSKPIMFEITIGTVHHLLPFCWEDCELASSDLINVPILCGMLVWTEYFGTLSSLYCLTCAFWVVYASRHTHMGERVLHFYSCFSMSQLTCSILHIHGPKRKGSCKVGFILLWPHVLTVNELILAKWLLNNGKSHLIIICW